MGKENLRQFIQVSEFLIYTTLSSIGMLASKKNWKYRNHANVCKRHRKINREHIPSEYQQTRHMLKSYVCFHLHGMRKNTDVSWTEKNCQCTCIQLATIMINCQEKYRW